MPLEVLTDRSGLLEISHGDRTLHLVVMVPLRELHLAQEGVVVEPQGPTLAFQSRRLCDLVRPYVAPR